MNDKKSKVIHEPIDEQIEAGLRAAIEIDQHQDKLKLKYGTFPSSVEYIRKMREDKI